MATMTEPFNKATVTFDFEHKDNANASLLIGTPVCVDDGEWRCPYQFVGLSNSRTRWIPGADATQALELAIRVATGAFSQLDEVQNGTVTWLETDVLALAKG
jgi:hypothetical protein